MAPLDTHNPTYASEQEARQVISDALEAAAHHPVTGPILAAADVKMRIELTDLDLAVDIRSDPDGDERSGFLRWEITGGVDDANRADRCDPAAGTLCLCMDSETGNRCLQGSQSVPIAIARGQIKLKGRGESALYCLPATKLIAESYREVLTGSYPHLTTS